MVNTHYSSRRAIININVGSLNPNEIYDAFYNPNTRRLIQVTLDNIDYAQSLVEQVQSRRNLLTQSGILTNPYNLQ